MSELVLPTKNLRGEIREIAIATFAHQLEEVSAQIGFKVSSRGWCYILEGTPFHLINKGEFDRVESLINQCREQGLLPIDFTAEEEGRKFDFTFPDQRNPKEFLKGYIEADLHAEYGYKPDLWKDEKYYIQTLVEKIDLKTLFAPLSKEVNIPIATSKGWSSLLQRAEYARRFKEAEEDGKICVLLYCGDHDPDGLRISDFLRKNVKDVQNIKWSDGTEGYDPTNLEISRFGLDYDFIEEHQLTWIDGLITGSGKDLGSPSHSNHYMPYVQEYIKKFGKRKCEANAIVVIPDEGRKLYQGAVEKYLGFGFQERFKEKGEKIREEVREIKEKTGLQKALEDALKLLTGE